MVLLEEDHDGVPEGLPEGDAEAEVAEPLALMDGEELAVAADALALSELVTVEVPEVVGLAVEVEVRDDVAVWELEAEPETDAVLENDAVPVVLPVPDANEPVADADGEPVALSCGVPDGEAEPVMVCPVVLELLLV